MSWANLLKTTLSKSTSLDSVQNNINQNQPEITAQTSSSRCPIRLASLRDLLDFRRSGIRKCGITYPSTLTKASISLEKFCHLYQDQLRWLYDQIILPSPMVMNRVPPFEEFMALAWIMDGALALPITERPCAPFKPGL